MKNKSNILYLLLGAVFALGSCQSENIPNLPDEVSKPIEFSGVHVSVETKGTDDMPIDDFKVWASRTYTAGTSSATEYGIFGVTGTEVSKSITDNTLSWIYSPVRYWRPGSYNFMAVSPFSLANGEFTESGLALNFGDGWDLSTTQTELWMATVSDISNEVVPLEFNHMLSKLSFTAINVATDGLDIVVTGIKIYGICKKAVSYTTSEGWNLIAPSSVDSPYNSYTLESVELPSTGESPVLLTPQEGILVFPGETSLSVEVTFNHGGNTTNYSKSASITDVVWAAGIQYEYKINIGPDYIEFNPVSVQPWDDNNGNGYVADDNIEF